MDEFTIDELKNLLSVSERQYRDFSQKQGKAKRELDKQFWMAAADEYYTICAKLHRVIAAREEVK